VHTDRTAAKPLAGHSGPVRWFPWVVRAAWVAVAIAGAAAVAAVFEDRSDAVRVVGTIGTSVGWVIGVAAMAIPATASLTATRIVVPASVVVGGACVVADPALTAAWALLGLGAVATAVALSAETGQSFVQASAYGDEERFLLRPPLGLVLAGSVSWLLWSATVVAGPLLLAARLWLPGTAITLLAAVLTALIARSWHQLSRRWLVLVPAGLVLHDQVVLADTLMLRRQQVARLRLALADTDALDLTGPATGHAVEVETTEPVTALFRPSAGHPRGRAVHLTAYLASPSRPGRVLRAAAARRYQVG
jgi:hypothetical protein